MAEAKPYGKNIQNGIRLSCLLIEVGTPVVRKIFDSLVKPNLRTLLTRQKTEMRQYLRGSKGPGKPKLNKDQFKLLYGKEHHGSDKFDLTLLILLIQILCKEPPPYTTGNWHESPMSNDPSRSADLVRLRRSRNILYGHISTVGYDDVTFDTEWKKLADILIRLGAEESEITKWKEHTLDDEECKKYNEKTALLIVHDTNAALEMVASIENTISKQKEVTVEQKEHLKIMREDCEAIRSMVLKWDAQHQKVCMERMNNLLNGITPQTTLLDIFGEVKDTIAKTVAEEMSRTNAKLDQIVEKQGHMFDHLKEGKEQKEVIHDKEKADEVERMLSENKDAFKILLVNSPNFQHVNKSDLKELCQHLGCIPWDVIIDLDHNSRGSGIHDKTAEILSKHKAFQIITYEETKDISEFERQNIILGQKAIWILANGCSETKCPQSLEKFGKARMKITKLLSSILDQSQMPKSVLLMVLVQSGEASDGMREMVYGIKDVLQEIDYVVSYEASAFVEVHLDHTESEEILDVKLATQNRVLLYSSHRSFACMLGRLFQAPQEEIKYFFPGQFGEAYLTDADVAHLAPYMELYHRDIGKINFHDMEPREIHDKIKEISLHFHKGHPITPETIYINNKEQTYVSRTEIHEAKERLEEKLKLTKWKERERQPFYIDHDASGGGTTVATVLLFELKERYPCVRILKIDDALYQGLQILYNNSKHVLLLMIDNDQITDGNIRTMIKRLENARVKAQLIVTRRLMGYERKGHTGGEQNYEISNRIFVSGTLRKEDEMAFINLYKKYGSIQGTNRVFPIGLQAFLKDHSKLDQHIKMCIQTSEPEQLLVLQLSCIIWKYGQFRLSLKLVQAILQIGPDDMYDHVTDNLGYVNDFLLCNKHGEVKLASTCVIDKILEHAYGDKGVRQCDGYISDVLALAERTKTYPNDLSKIIHHVFIKREREADGAIILWSPFIQTMKKAYKGRQVAKHLVKLIESLQGTNVHPHMQALLARFYMHELDDPANSITTIHAALGIGRDQSVSTYTGDDSALLTTYGSLYRVRVFREKVKREIQKARSYFDEALTALGMAKHMPTTPRSHTRGRQSPLPFLQEARVRVQVLRLYLDVQFRGDRKAFNQFLRKPETEKFLQVCIDRAHEALDTIDFLRTQDRLNEDTDHLVTEAQRVRFDLLLLHVDHPGKVLKMIQALPDNIPCDVGWLVQKPSLSHGPQRKNWEELSNEELVFIIEEIMKRLTLSTVLRNNYADIVSAMIHIRNRRGEGNYDKYNLDFAVECAKQWVKRYKEDHHGHFMLGILKFVQAVSGEEDKIDEACQCFQICSKICSDLKSTSSYLYMRHYIGTEPGLAKLIPTKCYKEGDQLQQFLGRQVGKNHVNIKPFPESVKAFVALKDVVSRHEQQPLVRFNLALSHSGLKAINPVYIRAEEEDSLTGLLSMDTHRLPLI